MIGQDLLEAFDHRGNAAGRGNRDDDRTCIAGGEVWDRDLAGDELGRLVVALGDATLDQQDRIRNDVRADELIARGEQHHVEGGLEVFERRDRPDVALLGHLALHAGHEPTHGERAPVSHIVGVQRRDGDVDGRRENVLDPVKRVVGDVEPEHLALEGEQRGLVPLRGRDRWWCPRDRAGCIVVEPAEQGVLSDGLVALDVEDRVDAVLVDGEQALARLTE